MKQIRQLTWAIIFTASLIACKGKSGGAKKGSDLKGEEAKAILAGKDQKEWLLETGHDYYEYIQFEPGGSVSIPGAQKITYTVNGDNLTMKDYNNLEYKILEISDDKLVLAAPNKDTLTFVHFEPGSEEYKKRDERGGVNPKWLKGTYGTTWKFSEGGKAYSYMNDGRIIDAALLTKIADWKIEGKMLQFNNDKLVISRLNPIFFDYEAYGIPVKMNYIGEANPDGSWKK